MSPASRQSELANGRFRDNVKKARGAASAAGFPVYRHKSFEFGEGRAFDGKIAQQVRIIDADGVPWDALYTLEQEPDGSLKISGCVLIKVGQGA